MAKLIAIYAGYGDTLLLQEPAEVLGPNGPPQHKYWLIDGGPITSVQNEDQGVKNAYQQYLKLALKRFCASGANPHEIDLLKGIIVTHPDMDHIDGVIELIRTWLPDEFSPLVFDPLKPLLFRGPVVLNSTCFEDGKRDLCTLLGVKHFDVKGWNTRGNLRNESTDPVYEMNRIDDRSHHANNRPDVTIIDPTPAVGIQPGVPVNHQFDKSTTNLSSILTTWTNNNKLELVTTGDGLASHILHGMKTIQH